MSSIIKYIQAELIKLKYPPILWLITGSVMSISLLVFFAHYNDLESISAIGKNPWIKLWEAMIGIFSIFMTVPFLVLLISAAIFIENQNNTWKFQFTTPVSRIKIMITKLISIILIIIFTYYLLTIVTYIIAFLLNYLFPELEFSFYPIHFSSFANLAFLTFVNSLGVIGIQFYLSLRFRGFLVPASLGIVAFIIGLILGVTNTPVSHYFPYSYPLIGQDFNMFTIDQIGISDFGWINSIQICSIATFIIFVIIGLYNENKRLV